ncbi:MAG: F0F1 ATP synthase subunit A [Citromicrobium sp.]|nr:F0F1 ATP synthase subunit A [Citromicrobium sp.]
MAAEGKVDPMHQFTIEPLGSWANWDMSGVNIAFTNSALWMMITTIVLIAFVQMGNKRQLIPGRWQMAVESLTGFVDNMVQANIGKEGRKYLPYVFSLFTFILFANILGLLPLGVIGIHPFTFTSHFTVTGILAVISFSIVLIVGFWKHGLKFFTLFVPHGTPLWLIWLIPFVELVSFMVRPFSLALRLFVAMMAGHVLLEVLSSFVIDSTNAGALWGGVVGIPSFLLMIAICALELLVAGIQAYVFALLTALYINDAENLH